MRLRFMQNQQNFGLLLSLLEGNDSIPFDVFDLNATPFLFNPSDEYKSMLKENLKGQPLKLWAEFDGLINA